MDVLLGHGMGPKIGELINWYAQMYSKERNSISLSLSLFHTNISADLPPHPLVCHLSSVVRSILPFTAVDGPVTVGDPLTLLIHMKSEKGKWVGGQMSSLFVCEPREGGGGGGGNTNRLDNLQDTLHHLKHAIHLTSLRLLAARNSNPTNSSPKPFSRLRHSREELRCSQWRQTANATDWFQWVSRVIIVVVAILVCSR